MLAEIKTTNSDFQVALTPEQNFIEHLLVNPPSEVVEDVGAVSHETNRIPDPRILIVKDGKILRLDGVPVDDSIEKESYLGRVEYQGFREVVDWSNRVDYGNEAWFSAPYPEELPTEDRFYPVSKIDLGEIHYAKDGTKILLKRAILLDIDGGDLLKIANNFAQKRGHPKLGSIEELRATPMFFTPNEIDLLLAEVSIYTDQIVLIENGEDLSIKLETYSKLNTVYESSSGEDKGFVNLKKKAQEKGMIGKNSESCPNRRTAFQAFSVDIPGFFSCPRCGGLITSGVGITRCPHCELTKEEAALLTGVACI